MRLVNWLLKPLSRVSVTGNRRVPFSRPVSTEAPAAFRSVAWGRLRLRAVKDFVINRYKFLSFLTLSRGYGMTRKLDVIFGTKYRCCYCYFHYIIVIITVIINDIAIVDPRSDNNGNVNNDN